MSEWSQGLTQTKNLNDLWVQERNPDILSFSLKKSWQVNPLQVPQQGPYGERYLLTGHFYISLNISHFFFPSESPIREPPPCSLTGSPWAAILRHQSHCGLLFIHSFIHVCLPESPKGALVHTYGKKNVRLPSTDHHADGMPTYNGMRSGSPRGSLTLTLLTWRIWWAPNNASKWQMEFNLAFKVLMTLLSLFQRYAAFGTIPSTWLG